MGRYGHVRCLVSLCSVFLYGVANCSWIHGDGLHSTVNDQHISRHETNGPSQGLEHKDLTSPVVEIEHSVPTRLNEAVTLTGLEEETGEWAKEAVPEILKNLPIDPLSDKTGGVLSTGNGNVSQFHDVVAGKMDEFHENEAPSHDQPNGEESTLQEQHGGFGPFSNEMKSSPEEDHEYEWLDEPVQENVRPVEEIAVPGILHPDKPAKEQVLSQVETGLVYLMKTAHHSGITVQDIMGHLRNRLQAATEKQQRNHKEPEGVSGGAM